mmetsp:Transcript_38752/g.83475  ORF Transcript_38752/g.83475 Transcript_38752/m.83475 type:complete len:337 (+) Transcript_38752:131-1141(+)
MQTRRASRAAAAAVSGTTRAASVAVAASSPPRKKPNTQNVSRHTTTSGRSIPFDSEYNIQEEMRSLVLSRVSGLNDTTIERNIDTETIGGWCLVDGLVHCATASNSILLPLIKEHGPPRFYLDHVKKIASRSDDDASASGSNNTDDLRSFRSLCQIVSGQQLAGNAAKTIWRRLLKVVDATEEDSTNLTPDRILSIVENGDTESDLRAPAGLSNAKCNCIIAIAMSFKEGTLSDNILLGGEAADDEVRSRLLSIKGLGPWSVDMFLLFQCHKSDVLPIGDLAFRNGTSNLWRVKGKAKGGGLCQRKDEQLMRDLHGPFAPYRSLSSYYMYKCSGMK